MMTRAERNRTLTLSDAERTRYRKKLLPVYDPSTVDTIDNRIVCGVMEEVLSRLPSAAVDLLFLDPPYNLRKSFCGRTHTGMDIDRYEAWMEGWLQPLKRLLKPTASIYLCGDWRSSSAIQRVCERHFVVRNRITIERDKGRGARANWKNVSEDIWFCTVSGRYTFNIDAVKLKRKVRAPYRVNGQPKDWSEMGREKYRLTHPSNVWTDVTIPFWSMAENTPHPTQKPEKLLARILLASTGEGDLVLDPFAGSGTTGVVASKLNRRFFMVEREEEYCLYALKRLDEAERNRRIQGYEEGVFWERNSSAGGRGR